MRISKIEDMHADGGWRTLSFLKITTDEGLIGWSEFSESRGVPGLTMVIRKLAASLIGKDPRRVNHISASLYALTRNASGGIIGQAIAAIENACLDIKAKSLGVPVYELFGGALRDRLPTYWSHCGTLRTREGALLNQLNGTPPVRSLDDVERLGREVVERGYRALKTNVLLFEGAKSSNYRAGFGGVAGHPELNLDNHLLGTVTDVLAAFRQGAGGETGLMLDLNFNFKPEGARIIAKAIEQFRPVWLEFDIYDPKALAFLRRSTTVPIASLETIYGRRDLKPFLDANAVDVAIVDVQWNGVMEAVRMAILADTYEVNFATHNYHGHLSTLMGAHFAAVIPNFRIMEYVVDEVPWMSEFFTQSPRVENGDMLVPTGPGWGADVREEAVLARPPKSVAGAEYLLDFHKRSGRA